MEASISKNLLCKRVLPAWSISRNGARLNNYFENLFAEMDIHKISYGNNVFFWKQKQHPTEYTLYRAAGNDYDKRNADDIPPKEIANAIKQVLKEQISLSKDDLIRETAKLFMFFKVGNIVENTVFVTSSVPLRRITKERNRSFMRIQF